MVPDLILKAILADKKSVSEIFKFCENKNICQDTPVGNNKRMRQVVARQLFKVSGYRVDKDFDYRKLFGEMSKILLDYRRTKSFSDEPSFNIDSMMDEVVKITVSDKKSLAATGSIDLYAFLLHNGIDLRSSSPTGGNFTLPDTRSFLQSTQSSSFD